MVNEPLNRSVVPTIWPSVAVIVIGSATIFL